MKLTKCALAIALAALMALGMFAASANALFFKSELLPQEADFPMSAQLKTQDLKEDFLAWQMSMFYKKEMLDFHPVVAAYSFGGNEALKKDVNPVDFVAALSAAYGVYALGDLIDAALKEAFGEGILEDDEAIEALVISGEYQKEIEKVVDQYIKDITKNFNALAKDIKPEALEFGKAAADMVSLELTLFIADETGKLSEKQLKALEKKLGTIDHLFYEAVKLATAGKWAEATEAMKIHVIAMNDILKAAIKVPELATLKAIEAAFAKAKTAYNKLVSDINKMDTSKWAQADKDKLAALKADLVKKGDAAIKASDTAALNKLVTEKTAALKTITNNLIQKPWGEKLPSWLSFMKNWPVFLQWIVRIFFFGWIWDIVG